MNTFATGMIVLASTLLILMTGAPVAFAQMVQDGIGADRAVAVPDQFQHLAPQGRQANAALLAQDLGAAQGLALAMRVVVGRGRPDAGFVHDFNVGPGVWRHYSQARDRGPTC